MFSKLTEENLFIQKRDFYLNLCIVNIHAAFWLERRTSQSAPIERLFVNSGRNRKLLFFQKYGDWFITFVGRAAIKLGYSSRSFRVKHRSSSLLFHRSQHSMFPSPTLDYISMVKMISLLMQTTFGLHVPIYCHDEPMKFSSSPSSYLAPDRSILYRTDLYFDTCPCPLSTTQVVHSCVQTIWLSLFLLNLSDDFPSRSLLRYSYCESWRLLRLTFSWRVQMSRTDYKAN